MRASATTIPILKPYVRGNDMDWMQYVPFLGLAMQPRIGKNGPAWVRLAEAVIIAGGIGLAMHHRLQAIETSLAGLTVRVNEIQRDFYPPVFRRGP